MRKRKSDSGGLAGVAILLLLPALPAILLGLAFAGPILLIFLQIGFHTWWKEAHHDVQSWAKDAGLLSAYSRLEKHLKNVLCRYERALDAGLIPNEGNSKFPAHSNAARAANKSIDDLLHSVRSEQENLRPRFRWLKLQAAGKRATKIGTWVYVISVPILLILIGGMAFAAGSGVAIVAIVISWWVCASGWDSIIDRDVRWETLPESARNDSEASSFEGQSDGLEDEDQLADEPPTDQQDEESEDDEDADYAQDEKEPQTCYEILGISETATRKQIDAAFRAQIKLYHPDHNGQLPPKLQEAATRESAALNVAHKEALRRCAK